MAEQGTGAAPHNPDKSGKPDWPKRKQTPVLILPE